MEFIVKNISELENVASQLLQKFEHKVVLFYGEMGNGKTTLIKNLCKKLGVLETTSSPTFSIVNEYKTIDDKIIYHFDFYRIKNENEVMDMGYEDYFYSNNYCFVEWAENIPNLLPENYDKVVIQLNEAGDRIISI